MPSRDQARGLGKPSREQIARGVFLFFIVLSLAFAGLSFIQGFLNALNHSQDFQWSPASLFLRRINPYQVYLDGNRADEIILSQVPNYAQLLYVLFAPFGAMPFSIAKAVWAITNICLAIFAPLASARLFSLTSRQAVVAIAIFAMSTPTRNTIGNGQHSLFILAAFLCALLTGEPSSEPRSQRDGLSSTWRFLSPIMAGISYLKYSFAPTLGVAYMRRYGFRYFLYSFLPVLAGIFIFSIWVAKGAISLDFLSQPLRVASSGVSLGAGDLLSVLRMYLPQEGLTGKSVAIACLLLAGSAPFWVRPNPGDLAYWSFCSVASLSFVTHLGYDYVFLLLPAVFAIKNIGSRIGVLMASLVSFPWFITKILIGVGVESGALMHFGLAVNLLMLWLLWIRMHKDTRVSMV